MSQSYSSGRRETPEQIAEAKLRAANKYSQEANLGLAKTNTVHSVANSKIKNHNLTRQFDLQESAEDDDELFIEGDDGEIEVCVLVQ